jgi:F-type H+-transporting ATPase subunit epsilon
VPFELIIVTPYGPAFERSVESVVLPGSEGDFGVLPSHERFLTPLRIGEVEIRDDSGTVWAAIADGFADVSGERVVVLVESCEVGGDIDTARAELARERAEQDLSELGVDENAGRYAQFEAALRRAQTRLEVAKKSGS